MKLSFCGAARAVTGSCHMLTLADGRRYLVDCGMRQGEDAKGAYGEDTFPFDPSAIDAVFLTHAHIDHSGLLPLLVKRGFTGTILTTDATMQLSAIMLPDSAHIQEQEAEWQTRKNERAGKAPADPLYTMKDVERTLKQFRGVSYDTTVQLADGIRVRFLNAGHLLGSAAIEVFVTEDGKTTKVVFSGDVGRDNRPILEDPEDVSSADYLVLESTYGDRDHALESDTDKESELAAAIRAAIARGGNLVIPSFAVGRTQELLYYIKRILKKNLAPGLETIPVYIDSPLGINATKVYERCAAGYYDAEAREMAKGGSPFDFPTLRIAVSTEESKAINITPGRKIIISSSGMCDAGRIRHHLKHNLYRADSTVLFAGYQAVGTLGRALVDGVKKIKLFGEDVRINADIVQLDGFSGHAGRSELVSFVQNIPKKPRRIYLVHGEDDALASLSDALTSLGYDVTIPSLGDEAPLTAVPEAQPKRASAAPKRTAKSTAIAKPAPAAPAEPASAEPTAAMPLAHTAPAFGARQALARMEALLDRSEERRSPDMELLRTVLEADLRTLADKWEKLI